MRIDPDGIDLGWFAVDQDGHVGFFTSGGSRVVPEAVLSSPEALDGVKKAIHDRPRSTLEILRWALSDTRKHWADMAARGLFAYDFHSHDTSYFEEGEYRQIARPYRPFIPDSRDPNLGRILSPFTMTTICFARENLIKKDLIKAF
jgi:hypothetical protein